MITRALKTALAICLLSKLGNQVSGSADVSYEQHSIRNMPSYAAHYTVSPGQGHIVHWTGNDSIARVTLSICNAPEASRLDETLPPLLYTSQSGLALPNASDTQSSFSQYGYSIITAHPMATGDGQYNLSIGIFAPTDAVNASSNRMDELPEGNWDVLLTITTSLEGLRFPTFNTIQGLKYLDSDNQSAIFDLQASSDASQYAAVVAFAETSEILLPLAASSCYVLPRTRNATELPAPASHQGNSKSVFAVPITPDDLGDPAARFHASGLEAGLNYTVWLLFLSRDMQATSVVHWPLFFATKKSRNCRLMYDIDFCPGVEYSVPAPPEMSNSDVVSFYHGIIRPGLLNFERTLSAYHCHGNNTYSRLATCEACLTNYVNWICGVKMPRCTDTTDVTPAPPAYGIVRYDVSYNNSEDSVSLGTGEPDSAEEAFVPERTMGNGTEERGVPDPGDNTSIPASPWPAKRAWPADSLDVDVRPGTSGYLTTFLGFQTVMDRRSPNESRTPTLSTSAFPYGEVPPCESVCWVVESTCPPFVNFHCPDTGTWDTGMSSYGHNMPLPFERMQAGDEIGSTVFRSSDNIGNVYCNAFRTDLLWSALGDGDYQSAAPSLVRVSRAGLLIAVFGTALFVCL